MAGDARMRSMTTATRARAEDDHADVDDFPLSPEDEAELARRIAEAEADPSILIPLEDVLAKLSSAPC